MMPCVGRCRRLCPAGSVIHLAVHEAVLQPGFDLAGFNRLADELEDEAILAAQKRPRP